LGDHTITEGETSDGRQRSKESGRSRAATLEHVVKVTLYLHDLKYRLPFHDVWMEYFPKDPPARIAIQVADANAQPGRDAHFALDVIALNPKA